MSAFHPVTGLALILLVSGSLLPGARDAAARSRETTVTTPRGTTTRDTTTQCADGSCTRNRSVTGPNGQTRTKTGTATKTGTGSRSEEHTSELQSLMRTSYAVFCLKKTKQT